MTEMKLQQMIKSWCYICHKPIENGHRLCPKCEKNNSRKREELSEELATSTHQRVAVVTGGRIKIGYETCLKLLRSGCFVILTTRFPVDAAYKYANENDFENWCSRLKIYKIDFRNILQVEEFAAFLNGNLEYIDILINNAAQTVRRPKEYYDHLQELENQELQQLPAHIKALNMTRTCLRIFSNCKRALTNCKLFAIQILNNYLPTTFLSIFLSEKPIQTETH
jgi:restriction endonuclease S subunit